jgi:hypothetical protein
MSDRGKLGIAKLLKNPGIDQLFIAQTKLMEDYY